MKGKFTQSSLKKIEVTGKAFWKTDEDFQNLRLYVGATGMKTWYVSYRGLDGKKQSHKLGSADIVTVVEARDMARDFLARLARGEEPAKKPPKKLQLGEFLETYYRPWVEVNRKTGKETMAILRSSFGFIFQLPVEELTKLELEKWQMQRQNDGSKAATINRLVTSLKAAINWGVDRELIELNPLTRLKPLQEHDSEEKVRYLSDDEKKRLMAALDEREARLRAGRERHNDWLIERGKESLPSLDGGFADYLKPLVLMALNTGIRQGALFALKWEDADFDAKTITLRAANAKTGKIQRLPMNKTVADVLTAWRQQSANTSPAALIFPSQKKKDATLVGVKRSWEGILKAANIEDFRWHDMRHDFASQLVMSGVDLNVVRELLGHSDMKMTLRYAHLAPESKLRAVELLDVEKLKS
ncbi:MAG: site-specific integrase [Synergistaceae bacterium]|nr:site-specific integrase [Synergistaceae bacterium]